MPCVFAAPGTEHGGSHSLPSLMPTSGSLCFLAWGMQVSSLCLLTRDLTAGASAATNQHQQLEEPLGGPSEPLVALQSAWYWESFLSCPLSVPCPSIFSVSVSAGIFAWLANPRNSGYSSPLWERSRRQGQA